jgi:hypothetical protein
MSQLAYFAVSRYDAQSVSLCCNGTLMLYVVVALSIKAGVGLFSKKKETSRERRYIQS